MYLQLKYDDNSDMSTADSSSRLRGDFNKVKVIDCVKHFSTENFWLQQYSNQSAIAKVIIAIKSAQLFMGHSVVASESESK